MGRNKAEQARRPAGLKTEIFAFGGKARNAMRNKLFLLCLLSGFRLVLAQNDTVFLKEANLSDSHLLRYNETQSKVVLSDSVLQRNGSSLTNLLLFNSSIYLKENGAGMVSSPSFRGTTASQTAVVWNGININSQFLGQTDFNTVNTLAFDNLIIKAGGGSIAYGSGAIGGSIHLNNELRFNNSLENNLLFNYGSFDNYGFNLRTNYSDEKISLNLNFGRNGSDNDYEIPNSERKNLNGQFYNNNLSIAAGYKFNPRNLIKFYGNLFDGKRHFSVISPNAIKTKYENYNTRSMLEWNSLLGNFVSNFKVVHLGEEYRYYPTLESTSYEFGDAQTWTAKYDLGWAHKKLFLNAIMDFNHTEATGSNITSDKRQIGSASLLLKHKLNSKFLYEASVRKEFTDAYKSPFLYSFGLKWDAATFYQLRINTSKNFRMPTFNDLYWPGSGNLGLKPEISHQAEVGNRFHLKNFRFGILGYYNSVKDLIQWIPAGTLWMPQNVGKVKIYGIESQLNYTKKFSHQQLEVNTSYAYTVSENDETGRQLIYVPFHKSTASIGYSWKRISAYYQFLYNGKVFTDSQNANELDGYTLSNFGLEMGFGKERAYKLGVQILNLWNEEYQNVQNRPMPGRNYNVYINLKF